MKSEASLPTDLSAYQRPIGHFFEQPGSAKEWAPYVLTRAQVDSFRTDPEKVLFHVIGAWRVMPGRELYESPKRQDHEF